MDDLGGLRRGQVDVRAGDRHEDDVDVAEPLEVRSRELVAEISEMADHEIVEAYREDRVPSTRRALLIVVVRGAAGDEHLAHLVFAGPAEHYRLASDGLETRMPRVVVRDGDDRSLGLWDGVTRFGVGRVGQHDPFAAAHAKTRVAEPGEVHGVGREYAKHRAGPPGRASDRARSWPCNGGSADRHRPGRRTGVPRR